MTDIRSRMTTKGPEAPAMLGHPDIMVFVLVVFWCVTLCDFVTCYSGCKNSCKYLVYVHVIPVLQPRLQKLQRNSWVSHTIIVYHAKYRGMFQNIVICGSRFATGVAKMVAKIAGFCNFCNPLRVSSCHSSWNTVDGTAVYHDKILVSGPQNAVATIVFDAESTGVTGIERYPEPMVHCPHTRAAFLCRPDNRPSCCTMTNE